MGLEPSRLAKILNMAHNIFVPAFAIVWIIAMIKLWDWNVEHTGAWFAFAMVFMGFLVLIMKIIMEFNLWDKFRDWLAKKREEKKNDGGYIR